MKKVTAINSDLMTIKVGRFNESTKEVEIAAESTVEQVLDELGISLEGAETLMVEGVRADMDDVLEDGDRIVIVPKKDGGDGEDAPEPAEEVEASEEDKEDAPTPEKE